MDILTDEQILEKYEQLPHDLKEAIFSVEMTETIKSIGDKYKLAIDKIGALANESGMVMFGATRPKDFVPNIMSRLGVDKDTANKIASDVNFQVFLKVRESLKKLHGGEEITPPNPPLSGGATTSPLDKEGLGEVKKEDILKVLEHPELPTILQGANKPEEVQNLFEVKTKEEAPRAPMETTKYKDGDPYREPTI
ncbi:MAG: hypothetical protein WC587_00775 [Candidatus Paceibacterota bacterium]